MAREPTYSGRDRTRASDRMDALTFVSNLIEHLAWPLAVLVIALVFRRQIGDLIDRMRSVKALGAEGTFDPRQAEATVALATAQASAQAAAVVRVATDGITTSDEVTTRKVSEPTLNVTETVTLSGETYAFPREGTVTERFISVANRDPQAAVLESYEEVERVLRRRMEGAKVAGVEKLTGEQLIDVALRKQVVNRKTAEAARGILVLRNLAAHDRDIGLEKALDYLALADGVVYSIEVGTLYTLSTST